MARPQLNSALVGKLLIYGFIALIAMLFAKAGGKLEPNDRIRLLAFYIPAAMATAMMFTAGINFSLGVIIQKSWLIFAAAAQYCWLFYFEFMFKASGAADQLDYYKRAIYYVPVFIAQILIDRFLHKSGSIERWFYKAKLIADIAMIAACIWNFSAFDVYFSLKQPAK